MLNFLSKIIFLFKKPKIIIVTGNGRFCAAETIFQVLSQYFKVKKIKEKSLGLFKEEILVFETKLKDIRLSPSAVNRSGQLNRSVEARARDFSFFVKNSKLPILIVTQIGDILSDKDFFTGEGKEGKEIKNLAKILPSHSRLILNFDDEAVREIKNAINLPSLTFGFQDSNPPSALPLSRAPGADLWASDLKFNSGINFKINYQGNIVPIWLDNLFGKENVYAALAAVSAGIVLDLNLVEISQALKSYQGFPGDIPRRKLNPV